MQHVLFVCGRNRLRSPTAEDIFANRPGIEVQSAGLNQDADQPLTPELVAWADIIFVMEKSHRTKLSRDFRGALNGQRVICLNIPDKYAYMQPELIELLERKASPHFPE